MISCSSRIPRCYPVHAVLVLAGLLLLAVWARDAVASDADAVVAACWSSATLDGDPHDKASRLDPVRVEPAKLAPETVPVPLKTGLQGSIRSVSIPDGRKVLALTFDLCEREGEIAGYDADVVNWLRKNGVKATFFAGGKWMATHPEKAMQLMADPLFEIGNHTWTHGNLRVLTGRELEEQILKTQAEYEALLAALAARSCASPEAMRRIPPAIRLLRFPYGACSPEALDTAARLGLAAIQWDVVTADPWNRQTSKGITDIVLSQARPGSIVVMHANGRGHGTAQALPLFVSSLKAQGYSFVTVSELLSLGRPVAADQCYEVKPGDNLRYDAIFGRGTEARRQ